MKSIIKTIALVFLLLLVIPKVYSTTYYSRATGNWTTAATWSTASCGGAAAVTTPTSTDIVYICSGHTVTMSGNAGACQQLFINGTAQWTSAFTTNVGSGGVNISATGNITGSANGILTTTGGLVVNKILSSNTVTIIIQTTAGQTISGTGSVAKLTVSATTTNNGSLTVRTTLAGVSTLTQGAGATLTYAGTAAITPTIVATAANNTVNYSGTGNQTIKSTTYYNLTISNGGTSTLGGAITVNNNLTVSGGTLACSTYQITGNASGTFTLSNGCVLTLGTTASATAVSFPTGYSGAKVSLGSTSMVTYQGNYAQPISTAPTSYGNLTVSTGAATVAKAL